MLIVSDCMVYPDPKLNIKNLGLGQTIQLDTIKIIQKDLIYFLRLEAGFFLFQNLPSSVIKVHIF